MKYALLGIAGLVVGVGCGSKSTDAIPAAPAVSFATVQPIFAQNCAGCHGEANPKAGISLTSYANLMKSSAIKAGDPAGSVLIQAMRGKGRKQMPPNGPLPEDKIAAVETWIKAGAKE